MTDYTMPPPRGSALRNRQSLSVNGRVPDQKRLTWFYPDFGCYVLNYYVTAEQLDAAAKEVERQKALAAERRRSRKQHERQER